MSPRLHSPNTARNTLSMKLGRWFEATATGWGVIAIPAVLALLLAFAAAKLFWF